MVEGLRSSLAATGHPLNLLVMRKGATAELNSNVTQEQFQTIKVKPGLFRWGHDALIGPINHDRCIRIARVQRYQKFDQSCDKGINQRIAGFPRLCCMQWCGKVIVAQTHDKDLRLP